VGLENVDAIADALEAFDVDPIAPGLLLEGGLFTAE
jgi:hypothetical protein